MSIFNAFKQNSPLTKEHELAVHAKRRAEGAQQLAETVDDRVARLALVTQALWELASERLGISESELAAKVEQIDLRDGKLDGKLAEGVSHCVACKRAIHRRHRHCLYCGAEVPRTLFP